MRFSYACVNNKLPKPDKTMRKDTFLAMEQKELFEFVAENFKNLLTILKWNVEHDIYLFRVSSSMVPFYSLQPEKYKKLWTYAPLVKICDEIKKMVIMYNMRLTQHGVLFIKLANDDLFEYNVRELTLYTMVYEMILPNLEFNDPLIVIHVGGIYNDRIETLKKWHINYLRLPNKVAKLIVLENDEQYSFDELINFCLQKKIPMVFDIFHDTIRKGNYNYNLHLQTWGKRTPEFHYSEQDKNNRIGTHSLTVDSFPEKFLHINADCILETKDKEISVLKFKKLYK